MSAQISGFDIVDAPSDGNDVMSNVRRILGRWLSQLGVTLSVSDLRSNQEEMPYSGTLDAKYDVPTSEAELLPVPIPAQTAVIGDLARLWQFPDVVERTLEDCEPIKPKTLEYANKFLIRMFMLVHESEYNWISPHLVTEGEGDIGFEWWHNEKALAVTVEPTHSILAIMAHGPNIWNDMEDTQEPERATLLQYWQQLFD